ncbi:Tetratricopeptide repeat (TPR)-like superfamily protein [Forsythia ovata]|uniref:Tetratricopeptide repeat (TPR)-like superfamily protein n=1 Tax=Forsythia ovata TaxID=205694 RepID=A0ABD1TMS9_9LAMI
MAKVPSKHSRDQFQDFEGLLNNLQDWELSFKDKDKKLKSQSADKDKLDLPAQRHSMNSASQHSNGTGVNGKQPVGKTRASDNLGSGRQYDYLKDYDAIRHLSGGFTAEESVDANSEKELGNEFFKQKKFNEAIDCYSRSIVFSPTAVAYANRAMAYIKVKRFQEAENDCTEALNLDDRYIKAYSRRSTARKELGKLKESFDDAAFALRLEPHNQEVKKQYAEVKSLLEKEILKKTSGATARIFAGSRKSRKVEGGQEQTYTEGPICLNKFYCRRSG